MRLDSPGSLTVKIRPLGADSNSIWSLSPELRIALGALPFITAVPLSSNGRVIDEFIAVILLLFPTGIELLNNCELADVTLFVPGISPPTAGRAAIK